MKKYSRKNIEKISYNINNGGFRHDLTSHNDYCATQQEALEALKKMREKDFQKFFKALPQRVQMLVRSGFVDWREVLPEWYLKRD